MGLNGYLERWQKAGLMDAAQAGRLRAFEAGRRGFRFSTALLGLGALAIALGVMAIISANWDRIPAFMKLASNSALLLVAALTALYAIRRGHFWLREGALFLLAAFALGGIALIGQIYQTGAPLWMALTLWMGLITPFLFAFARLRFTLVMWVLAALVTLATAAEAFHQEDGDLLALALSPFALLLAGENNALRRRWPVWPPVLSVAGYAVGTAMVSLSHTDWYTHSLTHDKQLWFLAGATALLGSVALAYLRRRGALVPRDGAVDVVLPLGVVIGFLPFLMDVPGGWNNADRLPFEVAGAILFMLFWGAWGWAALRLGARGFFNLAVTIVAIRLFIVYLEVFGSLLDTGLGLIASGVVMMILAFLATRVARRAGGAS